MDESLNALSNYLDELDMDADREECTRELDTTNHSDERHAAWEAELDAKIVAMKRDEEALCEKMFQTGVLLPGYVLLSEGYWGRRLNGSPETNHPGSKPNKDKAVARRRRQRKVSDAQKRRNRKPKGRNRG